MRKSIIKSILLLPIVLISFIDVKADNYYYTNINGVKMSEEQYNKIINIFSEKRASVLTQEQFDKYINGEVVSSQTIYQKVKNTKEEILSMNYISKEEYDHAPETENVCDDIKISNRSSDYGYIETTYKRFSVSLIDFDDNQFELIGDLLWKRVPTCRSYDVYAFRLNHMSYSGVVGIQTYFVGDSHTDIYYNSSSQGYKSASNGAGFSMNLKDDSNITSFDMTLMATLAINNFNSSTAHVYITYQHAITNLSRTTSMSYTFDPLGLGDVVFYNNTNISQKYDDMDGIHLMTPI